MSFVPPSLPLFFYSFVLWTERNSISLIRHFQKAFNTGKAVACSLSILKERENKLSRQVVWLGFEPVGETEGRKEEERWKPTTTLLC